MNSLLKISIIIPTFNAVKTIGKSLQSVISKTYFNKKNLNVDGGSTDPMLEIFKSFDKHIFYLLSEKDKKNYDEMNKGIKGSTGNWLYLLESDDRLYTNNVLFKISNVNSGLTCELLYNNVIFSMVAFTTANLLGLN